MARHCDCDSVARHVMITARGLLPSTGASANLTIPRALILFFAKNAAVSPLGRSKGDKLTTGARRAVSRADLADRMRFMDIVLVVLLDVLYRGADVVVWYI